MVIDVKLFYWMSSKVDIVTNLFIFMSYLNLMLEFSQETERDKEKGQQDSLTCKLISEFRKSKNLIESRKIKNMGFDF